MIQIYILKHLLDEDHKSFFECCSIRFHKLCMRYYSSHQLRIGEMICLRSYQCQL